MQQTLIDAQNKGFYVPDLFTYFLRHENFRVEHIWVYEIH